MRLAIRRLAAPFIAVLVLAGCQGRPVTLLTDPDEILAAAATTAAAATSVHVDVAADGTVAIDLLGTGSATPIDLTDTTLNADLDLRSGTTKAAFAAPALIGLAGEVVVADAVYLKSTFTGPRYRKTPLDGPPQTPLKGLTDLLARADLAPTKGADAACPGGTCYTIDVKLDAAELGELLGGVTPPAGLPVPMPDVSVSTVDLTLHIEQTTTRLADATAEIDLGDSGTVSLQATFTKWNEPVQIDPPPADQVDPAG
jgi:hypothetical protein